MMHSIKSSAILIGSLMGAVAMASDIPPNVVDSDSEQNTAMGSGAMGVTTSGTGNTAAGSEALDSDNDGSSNTAVGASAMTANNDGNDNTAVGFQSLLLNNGNSNTAVGFQALLSNTTGNTNIAVGPNTLRSTSNGSGNVAMGYSALYSDTSGYSNLAFGYKALFSNKTGENNVALGNNAGYNVTGNYNIEIGSLGVNTDQHVIRIGSPSTQSSAYIAGISTTKLTGAAVYVNSSGQLGVLASSERYKTAIAPMGANTSKLRELRPVTFHLKNDPKGAIQYGLIAEQVDKVYPELVIRDGQGKIQGVRYDELAPMLLNEMQQQAADVTALKAHVALLQQQNDSMQAALTKVLGINERLAAR